MQGQRFVDVQYRMVTTWIGAACLCALAAVSAAQAQDRETIEIEIGNLATLGFANDWLDYEISAFEKAHPGIRVKRTPYDEPSRYDHPLHENPFLPRNIIGLDSSEGAEAAYLAEKGEIVPIENFMPDPGFAKDQFYENFWDAVTYAGQTWGVPWQAWTDILVCDMELFAAAGIESPPANIEEMIAMIPKLTNLDAEPEQFGFRISASDDPILNLLVSLILQQNGVLIQDNKISGTDPAIGASLEMLYRLIVEPKSVNVQPGRIIAFEFPDRVYAMQLVQTSNLPRILGNPKYRLAPMPTLADDNRMCPRRLYFAIRKSTPDEERASWELVKWMVRKDVSIPKEPLGYPCRKDTTDRPEFKALAKKGPQNLEFVFTGTEKSRDLGIFALNRGRALDEWTKAFAPALEGSPDFPALIQQAAESGNRLLFPLPDYVASGANDLRIYE